MRPIASRLRQNQAGSLLITAAVGSAIVAILIGGGLAYISNEYMFNLRSHRWHQALHLAEAGIEMSFAEFNDYYRVGSNAFSSARGWSAASNGYQRVCLFTNAAGEEVGLITNNVGNPLSLNPYLQSQGYCTTTPRGPIIGRRVTCYIALNAQFPAAMVSKNKIDMKGNNIATDSYDSSDITKSTNARYDAAKKQSHGDVASTDTITNTVDISIGNANIYGQVLLSPSGSVTMGPNGSIGPYGSPDTTVAAAQADGNIRNDFSVSVPDVTLPAGASSWYYTGSLGNTTLSAGDYTASNISLNNHDTLVINGAVRIYVTTSSGVSVKGQITVNPGSSLTVYSAGSLDIGGNGLVNNGDNAASTTFYGLPTCTSVSLHGNANWTGVVYAPEAAFTLGGGGSSGDFQGSIVARSVSLNGQVQFHYDEALRKGGPQANFNVDSWTSARWNSNGGGWINDN